MDFDIIATADVQCYSDEIHKLRDECNAFDKTLTDNWLSDEINFDRSVPSLFLAKQNGLTIGFLLVFMPDKVDPEINAYVLPSYRNSGVFDKLFARAMEVLKKEGFDHVLFVVDSQSASGCAVAEKKISKLHHKEIYMSAQKPSPCDFSLTFEKCTNKNREAYTLLQMDGFDSTREEEEHFVNALFASEARQGYVAYFGTTPVGCLALHFDDDKQAFLYGVAIDKNFRRRGFGKQMLRFGLGEGLKSRSEVVLSVDSDNSDARNLYTHAGFLEKYEISYLTFPI